MFGRVIDIKQVESSVEWDKYISDFNCHPLQSALWGDARKEVDDIEDERLLILRDNQPVSLIRFERRTKPGCQIAWAAQCQADIMTDEIFYALKKYLKKQGYHSCVFNPYHKAIHANECKSLRKTVWIDLSHGTEVIWKRLNKQWRYGARRGEKDGVKVFQSDSADELYRFFQLCNEISKIKGFALPGSFNLMKSIHIKDSQAECISRLFLAKIGNDIAGGVFALCIGKTIHYIWGAVDRRFSRVRVGECLQWKVIEWACENFFTKYDLEGIDEEKNPGVSAFKKKMGGEVVTLADTVFLATGLRGKLVNPIVKAIM